MSHPAPGDLVRLFETSSGNGTAEALVHLLICPRCRSSVEPLAAAARPQTAPELSPTLACVSERRGAYRILDAIQGTVAASAADRENAPALLREILARPAERRLQAVAEDDAFVSPALAHRLLDKAETVWGGDPSDAQGLAALAAAIGQRLGAPWTLLEREALLGRARSVEGEALRWKGDMRGARLAHRAAFRHLEVLPVGAPERTDFCRYLARLRRDQGRDDEALALLSRAVERYDALPEPRRAAEARLELAWMHLDDLEAEEALLLLEQSVHEIEEGATAESGAVVFRFWVRVRHGLALAYADLRRDAEARSVLGEIRAAVEGRSRLDQLRLRVVEADVLQRLDENPQAQTLLAEAWRGLRDEGEPFEALGVLVTLAQLLVEQDAASGVGPLKEELPSFAELSPSMREAVEFGLDFAARHGMAGIEVLESMKVYLERAQHAPELELRLAKPTAPGARWEEVESDLRGKLVRWAGLEEAAAHLLSHELSPRQQSRLAWVAEATAEVRLEFAEPERSGRSRPDARPVDTAE